MMKLILEVRLLLKILSIVKLQVSLIILATLAFKLATGKAFYNLIQLVVNIGLPFAVLRPSSRAVCRTLSPLALYTSIISFGSTLIYPLPLHYSVAGCSMCCASIRTI